MLNINAWTHQKKTPNPKQPQKNAALVSNFYIHISLFKLFDSDKVILCFINVVKI